MRAGQLSGEVRSGNTGAWVSRAAVVAGMGVSYLSSCHTYFPG